ncbi:O-antigen translocase [Pseudomonas tructae]|uniref:O-antigen translocase n=1 Tax=Pseudomonas tructae TaxID=2518644 RepID=A0A411MM93_9PSED|nr:O-antigen translocase [Pseudomonas tructae]QBF27921.1 O-antigen translocase [Pseudomonas tructae]
MTLIKTSMLNGIAVIIKMLTLLGINKVLAVYVGPAGYAALGQFQNAVQMMTTFASGAINTGVTKYTAEYHEQPEKQHSIWRTAGSIALIGSLLASLIIALLNKQLAYWFLKDENFGGVFLWFAATLVLFTLNTLLLAILNGKKEVLSYVIANIAGSVFALLITVLMTLAWGLYGALVALAVYQSLAFFVTLWLCRKAPWFRVSYLFGAIEKPALVNLSKFTLMALASAICVPVSHILVRDHLGTTLGWEFAGYWEALWRMSSAYLIVATTTLSVYFLPRLSEVSEPGALRREIAQGYKLILPVSALCGLIIYLFRDLIISILFTPEFSPMRDLFAWQMIGDSLKIGSWLLAYLMLGKAMFKRFIALEVISASGFVFLTYGFTGWLGLEGVAMAHALIYLIYWVMVWRATAPLMKRDVQIAGSDV